MSKITVKYEKEEDLQKHISRLQSVYRIIKIHKPTKGDKFFRIIVDVE